MRQQLSRKRFWGIIVISLMGFVFGWFELVPSNFNSSLPKWLISLLLALGLGVVAALFAFGAVRPFNALFQLILLIGSGATLLAGLVMLASWVIVTAHWRDQAARPILHESATFKLNQYKVAIRPVTPPIILNQLEPVEIDIYLESSTEISPPLSIFVSLDVNDQLAIDPSYAPKPIQLSQTGIYSVSIPIKNITTKGFWRASTEIAVTVNDQKVTSFGVVREHLNGAYLRRFVGSTLDRSSPVIILGSFLISGALLGLRDLLRRGSAARQTERQRKTTKLVEEFRVKFLAGNIKSARKTYRKMRRFDYDLQEELQISKSLIEFATYPPHKWQQILYLRDKMLGRAAWLRFTSHLIWPFNWVWQWVRGASVYLTIGSWPERDNREQFQERFRERWFPAVNWLHDRILRWLLPVRSVFYLGWTIAWVWDSLWWVLHWLRYGEWPERMPHQKFAKRLGARWQKLLPHVQVDEDTLYEKPLYQRIEGSSAWPNEAVTAYITARKTDEKLASTYRLLSFTYALRMSREHLPEDKISAEIRESRLNIDSSLPAGEDPNWHLLNRNRMQPFVKDWQHDKSPELLRPPMFQHLDAGKELDFLFQSSVTTSSRAFWPNHSLFKNLTRPFRQQQYEPRPRLIFGDVGSGRTAFALGMQYITFRKDTLSLYLNKSLPISTIREKFVRSLLAYVTQTPSYLGHLFQNQRMLLAHLFATDLGKQYTLAELNRTLAEEAWEMRHKDNETWRRVIALRSNVHLPLLIEAVKGAKTERGASADWVRELVACCRALRIGRLHLNMDMGMADLQWLQDVIEPQFSRWCNEGLPITLLLPSDSRSFFEGWQAAEKHMLTWKKEDIKALTLLRYQIITNQPRILTLNDCIDPDALDAMIEKSRTRGKYNPRKFGENWRILQKTTVGDASKPISRRTVNRCLGRRW